MIEHEGGIPSGYIKNNLTDLGRCPKLKNNCPTDNLITPQLVASPQVVVFI